MNPLSLCQLTIETGPPMGTSIGDDILRTISAASKAGFAAVVPRIRPAGGTATAYANGAPIDVPEVRRRLADTGLRVASVLSYWITPETDPAAFRTSMDIAAEIGAAGLQVVCNEPDEARAVAVFAETCRLASARGLAVALEFMAYTSVNSLATARRLIAGAGQSNAGICLDALHFFRAGGSAQNLAGLAPGELALVQICDAVAQAPPMAGLRDEARAGRFYPGQGQLPLDDFFAALPPGCLLDVEAPCAADRALSVGQKASNAAAATRAFLTRQNDP